MEDKKETVVILPEVSPHTAEELARKILEELNKPKYAWERTYEGLRFTKLL